ncbi:hypothetical protein CK203_099524 [Vitis vinifera]|uniref:Uncharacterized protein n=1 Tax=Vitis vinifera TaxID=29760 RepID=A0A438EVY8_VITVI|nr:hypothetical protein CK203_099524 [Vitis vinifera]
MRNSLILPSSPMNRGGRPEGGSDDEEMNYFFRLKCEQCGWISENEECVNMAVQERAPGSSRRNNRVNLSLKCEGCERQGTITLVPGHARPLRVDDCTNVPLMVFYCNRTFPVQYSSNGGWSAVTEFGESINLNPVEGKYNVVVDGEYIEIKELKTKFEPYNGRHYACRSSRLQCKRATVDYVDIPCFLIAGALNSRRLQAA